MTRPIGPSGPQAVSLQNTKGTLDATSRAEKVAEDFEALFLDLMLQSMRKTAAPEDESNAQSVYKSMLDSEYARKMSTGSTFGIKELILDWLQKGAAQKTEPVQSDGSGALLEAQGPSTAPVRRLDSDLPEQSVSTKLATEIYALQLKALGR